jgi:Spy/CpxP family protein refolding chaperone
MKKWVLWLSILLLVVNVAALITILYNRKQENRLYEMPLQANNHESGSSARYSGRWFRDELGLSRKQMNEFSKFNPVFREKVMNINRELATLKRQMHDEMTSEESDTVRLNQLSDSIGILHSELKKATYLYYFEFKKIITAEQDEKLKQLFLQVFDSEIPSGHGRRWQGGRRNGNQP